MPQRSSAALLAVLQRSWFANCGPILVADMRRIIEKGEWPPDKRTKEFEPIASTHGTYWRLMQPQAQTAKH